MHKKIRTVFGALFFIFGVVVITFLIFSILFMIPRIVERELGPPDEGMEPINGWVYSIRLFLAMDSLLAQNSLVKMNSVNIEPGDSASEIIEDLFDLSVISNPETALIYLVYSGKDQWIVPGYYTFKPGLNTEEVINIITNKDPLVVRFTILEGWRWEEIAVILPNSGLSIGSDEFEDAIIGKKIIIFSDSDDVIGAEGYLLPGDYTLDRNISAEFLVEEITKRFLNSLPMDYPMLAADVGLTRHEAVILASIVQKEMVDPSEANLIASVFLNRLAQDIPLQSDPTVQYALGFQEESGTWWKSTLTKLDLSTDSPFNTYLYKGLPPAPIGNPGLEALNAVVYPTKSEFLYFRAACDNSGRHVFSRTYAEHLQMACE